MKPKKSPSEDLPKVHKDLEGFNIWINELGEVTYSHPIDKVNQFLNKKVVDKKLKDRLGYKSDEEDDTIEFMYE
jgi:hypothetical protein